MNKEKHIIHKCKESKLKVYEDSHGAFIIVGEGGIRWDNGLVYCAKCKIVIAELLDFGIFDFKIGDFNFTTNFKWKGFRLFDEFLTDDEMKTLTN